MDSSAEYRFKEVMLKLGGSTPGASHTIEVRIANIVTLNNS